MFDDLDNTLKAILDANAAPAELREAEVSFEAPERGFRPDKPTVNLFLYDVKENQELRDPVPVVERANGGYRRRPPPLRVRCTYMVTAWADQSLPTAERVAGEHRLLGQAFLWLSRFPTILPDYLQGSLSGQLYPPPLLVARLDGGRRTDEFWSALGIAPRPAFSLMATIALDLGVAFEAGPPVTAIVGAYAAGEREAEITRHIGGRVVNREGQPVAGALVELPELGFQDSTDAMGRYLLPRPRSDTFTLRVSAAGFQPVDRPLMMPAEPGEYEIALQPLAPS